MFSSSWRSVVYVFFFAFFVLLLMGVLGEWRVRQLCMRVCCGGLLVCCGCVGVRADGEAELLWCVCVCMCVALVDVIGTAEVSLWRELGYPGVGISYDSLLNHVSSFLQISHDKQLKSHVPLCGNELCISIDTLCMLPCVPVPHTTQLSPSRI